MNPKEAEKLAKTPLEDNYVTLELGYSTIIIMPHKQALKLLEALGSAEVYKKEYNKEPRILPVTSDTFCINFVSADTYREARLRQYLEGTEE